MTSFSAPVDARFRVYPQFDQPEWGEFAGRKHRLQGLPEGMFPGDGLADRLARALARHKAINLKELLESFELFHRTRRRIRRPVMVDLCAGHGLTGLIFALAERGVERVLLVDDARPGAHEAVLAAVCEVGPWVADKVRYEEASLSELAGSGLVPAGAGITAVHACGALTDSAIDVAIAAGGPVALLPCCYRRSRSVALPGLHRALGGELATDVARTYRLHAAGYQVDWGAIPRAITPMNRLIVGWRER